MRVGVHRVLGLALVLGLLLAWPTTSWGASVEGTITLRDVLERLPGRHPSWEAADRRIDAARGKRMSARGAFDPTLVVTAAAAPVGYYETRQIDVKVEQATPLWGTLVFAGWRRGQGNFAVYDGKLETAQAGELRAGVRVPLLRDGFIDRRRTDRRQTERQLDLAERRAEAKRLELQLAAAQAYWRWVGAHQRLAIVEGLLALADHRQVGLRRMVGAGAVAEIEAIDNERSIAERQLDRTAAQQQLDAAAVKLSLYWRDAEGHPRIPERELAPAMLPPLPPLPNVAPEQLVSDAQQRRPELAAIEQELQIAELEVRWARNQRAPDVSVQAYVARDFGTGPAALLPTELALSLMVEVPIPLRKARGQLQTAHAEVGRVRAERRLVGDEVTAELRTADIALRAALAQHELAEQQRALAEQVAAAERRRLDLGASTVLLVNLREQGAAAAATKSIDAAIGSHIAYAEHRVAQGLPPR